MIELKKIRRLLLDTNTLLLLYVGLFRQDVIPDFKRTKAFTREDFVLLTAVIGTFDVVVTTPHILAEVSNLSGHLTGDHREDYFALFAKEMAILEERHTGSATLSKEPCFNRLGLTDAGITQLARDEALVVLTADLDLYVHLA